MNHLLHPFFRKFVIIFFDDIFIYSPTMDIHLQQLIQVFQSLTKANFYLKYLKCHFLKSSVDYFGLSITSNSVEPDPHKIEAMLQWPIPTSLKQL